MIAAHKGHLKVVQILLVTGADVNITDKDEDSALNLAVQKGHSDIVKAFLEAGADTSVGIGALSLAASEGHTQTVQVL
jgi:hypothetical protein